MPKLKLDFYLQSNVVRIAESLLGKEVITKIDGIFTSGLISETEAYNGIVDKASHAYNGRRTTRTAVMYRQGGVAYVYLCYGIHSLFNVVTNEAEIPHAVLIRGIFPVKGIDTMEKRRKQQSERKNFSSGPGTASHALGINGAMNGISLRGNTLWVEDAGVVVSPNEIEISARIGVDYAQEDAHLPYRFRWKKNIID
jgi:DNA-3-methyladenine glycosylase